MSWDMLSRIMSTKTRKVFILIKIDSRKFLMRQKMLASKLKKSNIQSGNKSMKQLGKIQPKRNKQKDLERTFLNLASHPSGINLRKSSEILMLHLEEMLKSLMNLVWAI